MKWGERFTAERTRWRFGLLLIFLINCIGFHFLLMPEDMTKGQENHDTRIMYKHLRYWNEPTKWLYGDWPLQNGFYRPLPALAFEADIRLWGDDFPKYKILNWLICAACSFLLVGFVLSLTDNPVLALGSGALFTAWQTDLFANIPLPWMSNALALAFLIAGLLASKERRVAFIGLAAIVAYLGFEWANLVTLGDLSGQSFGYRTMGWPPGRTATLFGLFALLCLWAYCTWEKTHRARWLALSTLGFVGAFMSYEQAVMLPAALLACAIFLRLQGVRVHWGVHAVAWSLMAAYAWWHFTYLPIETRYATQHSSSVGSGVRSLLLWIFPAYGTFFELGFLFDPNIGLFAFLVASFWMSLLFLIINGMTWIVARRQWQLLLFGLLSSAVVFAPMAFQLRLTHYFYLPLAFRAMFVTALTLIAWKLFKELVEKRPQADAVAA